MKRVLAPISKRATLVLQTLGKMIKSSRLGMRMSQEMLAKRLNVSRLTVIALEKGNPTVGIGTVIEAAIIVGVPLLGEDVESLKSENSKLNQLTALLPKRAGRKKQDLNDDF